MSEPKRYHIDADCGWNEVEASDGEFVRYKDYARLKAERDAIHSSKLVYFIHGEGRWANVVEENARLKAQIDAKMEVGVPYADYERLFAENARLKAEVERLTKAGDATSQRLHWFCQKWGWKDDDLKTLTPEWNAAKEGKQS